MDRRLKAIQALLAAISAGDFGRRIVVSDKTDLIDQLSGGLNMVSEELKEVLVTKDFFYSIVNSVSDMILVLTRDGVVEEINQAVTRLLGYTREMLVGRSVDVFAGEDAGAFFCKTVRNRGRVARVWNRSFTAVNGRVVPVEIAVRPLAAAGMRRDGRILVTATDITARLSAENRLLRAVIDVQEQERGRLARDLHDELGQLLTGIGFLVSAVIRDGGSAVGDRLLPAKALVDSVQARLRGICYNLMPDTLEAFGLVSAVRDLCEELERAGGCRFLVRADGFPALDRPLEVDLFRVCQEFISNALRHGEATQVRLHFERSADRVCLYLSDNGRGFEVPVRGTGMGLRNMQTRIRSHGGRMEVSSALGKGTEIRVVVNVTV